MKAPTQFAKPTLSPPTSSSEDAKPAIWKKTDLRLRKHALNSIIDNVRRKFVPVNANDCANSLFGEVSMSGRSPKNIILHSSRKARDLNGVVVSLCEVDAHCHPPKSTAVPFDFCWWVASLLDIMDANMFGTFWGTVARYFDYWWRSKVKDGAVPDDLVWDYETEVNSPDTSLKDSQGEIVTFPQVPPDCVCFLLCTEPWFFFRMSVEHGIMNDIPVEPRAFRISAGICLISHLDICKCCSELTKILCAESVVVFTRCPYEHPQNNSPMLEFRNDKEWMWLRCELI